MGNSFEIIIENNSQCSVNVYMNNRIVTVERFQFQNPVSEPLDILFYLFALQAHFCFHVIEKGMRQHISGLHDHFVSIEVMIVSRLRENGDNGFRYFRSILFGNHLCHQLRLAFCHGIQAGLCNSVPDSRVIDLPG
ncbi:hypothetical protein SDC9_75390 [bioreactor metagenome]|uniref:Uncharacterized protein n=1 Tax=bioreactor metagenome TaxID=1076179 RepID=A0A644YKK5_9ZZZZ